MTSDRWSPAHGVTVCGGRQQTADIDADDGYEAASSPDWLAGPDPNQPDSDSDCSPDSGHPSDQLPMGSMSGKS